MAVERFPIEEGHVLMFARAIGDMNPVYTDREKAASSELGGIIAPPTFLQASAQFDPDYFLRPKEGQPWFGSGATPSGLTAAPGTESGSGGEGGSGSGRRREGGSGGEGGSGRRREGESRGSGGGSGLHAEQRFEYHKVVRAGDVLSATTKPGRTWEKEGRRGGTLHFSESVTEYRNQDGELVVTATAVGVRTERVPDQGSQDNGAESTREA
jgi:acyl dehydratase